jgi:hypothetical protein
MKKKKTSSDRTFTRTSKSWEAQEGAAPSKGQEFDPAVDPAAETSPSPVEPGPLPFGLPISDSEYERLKEKARSDHLPTDDIAQEDSPAERVRKKE